MKRIAIVVSNQHLKPSGGIATFCKALIDLFRDNDTIVDIIADSNIRGATKKFVDDMLLPPQINFFYPENALKYVDNAIVQSQFNKEGVNYQKILNFQNIFIERSRIVDYDLVIINTQEAIAGIATLQTKCPVFVYTHLYKQIFPDVKITDNFLPVYHTFYKQFLFYDNITVATQAETLKESLLNQGITNCKVVPMPLADKSLMTKTTQERSGVLFIGTTSIGKRYKEFLKVIEETKLPAKVMTSTASASKFKKAFDNLGITDYEIKADIIGQEKVDFIKSAKVCFMPSKIECYSYAFQETQMHMPVVVLDDQVWTNNFDPKYFIKTNKKEMVQMVQMAYQINSDSWYEIGAFEYICDLDARARANWVDILGNLGKNN